MMILKIFSYIRCLVLLNLTPCGNQSGELKYIPSVLVRGFQWRRQNVKKLCTSKGDYCIKH